MLAGHHLAFEPASKQTRVFHLDVMNDLAMALAGQQRSPHVLIKTHCWSDDWDPAAHPEAKVFLTHRDLQGVVASYQRVGWAFDIPDSYVTEHQRWRVGAQTTVVSMCIEPSD